MKILITENTIVAGAFADAGTLVEVGEKLPMWANSLIGDGKATADPARVAAAEVALAPAPVPESAPPEPAAADAAPSLTTVEVPPVSPDAASTVSSAPKTKRKK